MDVISNGHLSSHTKWGKLLDVFRMREFQCPSDVAKTYRPLRCWIRQGIRANMYGVIVTVFIVCSFFFHLLQKLCPIKFENALSVDFSYLAECFAFNFIKIINFLKQVPGKSK